MKKQQFEDFCLKHAQYAREEILQNGGSFRQQVVIVDLHNGIHVVYFEEVLHGFRMRDTLAVMAIGMGGADAFVLMADARFKATSDPNEMKRAQEAAARGEYTIADDERNPECLMTFGRSHEHLVAIFQPYHREIQPDKSCIITFEDPEPKIKPEYRHVQTDMLPNPWARVQ